MGRYIECKIDSEYEIVWKYRLGIQNSEMYRIYTEFGIGEYYLAVEIDDSENNSDEYEYVAYEYAIDNTLDVDGDMLILNKSDVERLKQRIQLLKQSNRAAKEKWFICMLEAIRDFIIKHKEQDKFIFEGEF